MWNLDFLRYSLPKFCISPLISSTHVTLLVSISVLYPLLLILLTWIFVTLHDRNVTLIVCLWRPFHKFFVRIRRRWDRNSDLINVFATFLLLSYSTLFYVATSYTCTMLYSLNATSGDVYTTIHPYTGVDLYCLNIHHYVLTILVWLFLGATQIPVFILIFYPFRWFRKCLSKCRVNCNGLNGERDMRSFAGFYFM